MELPDVVLHYSSAVIDKHVTLYSKAQEVTVSASETFLSSNPTFANPVKVD